MAERFDARDFFWRWTIPAVMNPTRIAKDVAMILADTPDMSAAPLSLLVKLGSIMVHADEATGPNAHHFDTATIRSLLEDSEVKEWRAEMEAMALLPVMR